VAYGSAQELAVPRWLKQRTAIWVRRIVPDWQVILHFQDRVTVEGTRCKATADWAEGYQTAEVYVAKWYYEEANERELDRLICHELYHLVHAQEEDAMRELVGDSSLVYKAYNKQSERAADKFAIIVVRAYARKRE